MAKLTPLARNMRKAQTDAERLLWSRLRNRGLAGYKFRRQYPVGGYIVDFLCMDRMLVVELDGGQHLDNPEDEIRTRELERQGLRVIRFWNNQVLNETDSVLEAIHDELLEEALTQ